MGPQESMASGKTQQLVSRLTVSRRKVTTTQASHSLREITLVLRELNLIIPTEELDLFYLIFLHYFED